MSERSKMLRQVQCLDFALFDAALYLDTHPDDAKAMKYYNHYQKQAAKARSEFEGRHGTLTHHTHNSDGDMERWNWTDSPWPWEYNHEERR
ncbi:MAG: spore coat protein CotJB [Oscillospiraceae bacterium]|nr:spore coat protein CotJB [Oscillospiraceae bacterium]